ncbi:MAG: energy-coupling factor transporter transmembrane protein EcfT [Lachnospiraceae bacterium]|nr:energy-coupling factor transporter transmembrane protein EcfT [Lachnospiraceae bacterium]
MDTILYGDDSKALVRFDPRTKLFIFLSCGLTSMYTYSGVYVLLFTGAICAVLALSGKPWTALKAFLLFSVALYVKEAVDRGGSPAPAVVLIVSVVTTLILYTLPTILSILLIVQTTRISQFLSALSAMHLPVRVVIPIAVLFRFIPTVQDEWNGIRKAMAFRGISLSFGSVLRHPWRSIEYVLVPLLFSTVGVMEELAAAALARGMDVDVRRSSYEEMKLRAADYVTMAVFAVLAGTIIIRVSMKGAAGL